jgi:hypothetical protein
MVFLIDYDRKLGKVKVERFEDSDLAKAQAERLRIELSDMDAVMSGVREVVLLEADDEKTLYRTHQRYFKSAKEIVDSMMDESSHA